MLRYLKLYFCFVRFSAGRSMEFRFDFFLGVVMCLVYAAILIAFYKVLYSQAASIGGWNENQAFILVGAYLVVDSVQNIFVSRNLEEFPYLVNGGDLDYYLVRPVSALFFISCRYINAAMLPDVFISCGVLAWSLNNFAGDLTAWQVITFALLLINGVFLYYLLWLGTLLPVFLTHSADGLHTIFFSFHRLAERPDGIYTGFARKLLVTVIPFCLMASFPARIIIEPFSWSLLLHILSVTAALFCAVLWLWSKALKKYSSASA